MRTYWIAWATLLNVLCPPQWEGNLKNGCVCICVCVCITKSLCCTAETNNIVKQLYSNKNVLKGGWGLDRFSSHTRRLRLREVG